MRDNPYLFRDTLLKLIQSEVVGQFEYGIIRKGAEQNEGGIQ